ncbi:hypothetical protein [uncultured Nocardioides sp.]|uniref:hypothetical protein n=1 Tax=uncultured Nocardioides sp. TaxID=198441 RepID=UPI002617FDA9|nr:hypothetical protein [uncultured Nocardioides sp.]
MSTAVSSTEVSRPGRGRRLDRLPGGSHVADVGSLLAMRGGLAHGRAARRLGPVLVVLTVAVVVVPAFVGPGLGQGRAFDVLLLLPSGYAAFGGLALASAIASGGGRELLPREQATPYPVSAATDHLGALVLAPLNIAWILQAWLLLGGTSYAVGPAHLVAAQSVVVAWLLAATAVVQVLAWLLEALRRRPYGVWVVRALGLVLVATVAALQVTGTTQQALDALPTEVLVRAGVAGPAGFSGLWVATVATLLVVTVLAVVAGAWAAGVAARRAPREEVRAETGSRTPRRAPRTDVGALLRLDRASVWRAVPMRRGLVVLAVMPGLIAVLGALPWESAIILPGLVASGGALLFGVNAWCLDGRGGLWRESLPVAPGLVFGARALVLAEALLLASGGTLVMAALRAGAPTSAELAAVLAVWVVVVAQAVSASMTWSARSPYAVDLRSARATPAPPAVMVVYSAKLALTTTLTGLVFAVTARAPDPTVPLVTAGVFLLWSAVRLLRARDVWVDPVRRAGVVTTVAA